MSEPFIGEIKIVPYTFAPRNWAMCDGQLLPISQNSALFSLLGTNFGGDGRTTFGLPNLRGRMPMHQGQGPGLSPRTLGQLGGAESRTIAEANLPSHTHTGHVVCSGEEGDRENPDGAYPAITDAPNQPYGALGSGSTSMGSGSVALDPVGSGQALDVMNPFLVLTFVIALSGIYPSRN